MLIAFTYLPAFVTVVFRGMPIVWRGRHRFMLCWLIFMQAVHPRRKTLQEMARWTPAAVTAWRFGRLLKATYWNVHLVVSWLAQALLATLPAPRNGVLYLFGDGSHADKRGTKNPVAQKGRTSQHQPWFFGLRFVLLIAAWDGYRVPVGFWLILPKRHVGYRSENALFREMVSEFVPPPWAKLVMVGGDAAYGSQANMRMVQLTFRTPSDTDPRIFQRRFFAQPCPAVVCFRRIRGDELSACPLESRMRLIPSTIEAYQVQPLPIVKAYADKIGIVAVLKQWLPTEMAVDPGTIVLAMMLDTLSGRSPLYRLEEFFAHQDTALLLGKTVAPEALHDDTVGRVLDRLYAIGTMQLFTACAVRADQVFGLDKRYGHFETTSVSVYGAYLPPQAQPDQQEQGVPFTITHG